MLVTRLEKVVNYKFFIEWSLLISIGLRHGPQGDAFTMKGDRPAHMCANELVRVFLKSPYDSILFLDSDADIDENFVEQFREYQPGWRYDILQAFCVTRAWPPHPVWYTPTNGATDKIITDPDLCEPVKAVGLHATLMRRRVFTGLLGKNDPETHDWFFYPRDSNGLSEDIAFAREAREAGYKLGATTAIRAGHHADMVLGWDTYQEWLETPHMTEAVNEVAVSAHI